MLFDAAGTIVFAACLLGAVVVGIYSNLLSSGPRKGFFRFLASGLLGIAFIGVGLLNLIQILQSGQAYITGPIGGLTQTHGKSSSSSFYVLDSNGRWHSVNCDYAGDKLVNGETVSIKLLNFHSTLITLTVIDGSNAGWSLKEGNGTIGSSFAIAFGGVLLFFARAKYRRNPEGIEEENDGRVPKNGVDSQSLLHLTSKDD